MMSILAFLGCGLLLVWTAESALFLWSYLRELRRERDAHERRVA